MEREEGPDEDPSVEEVLTDRDPFRLAIRGVALIDSLLMEATADAFRDGVPPELRRLPLPARVGLARALELIPADLGSAILVLSQIRNQFAHSMMEDMTEEHALKLKAVMAGFLPDVNFDTWALGDILRICMDEVYYQTGNTIEYAREQREEAEIALEKFRESRRPGRVSAD